jgi:hypothetical protein
MYIRVQVGRSKIAVSSSNVNSDVRPCDVVVLPPQFGWLTMDWRSVAVTDLRDAKMARAPGGRRLFPAN